MQRSRWQASLRSSGMGGKYGSATPLPHTSFEFRIKKLGLQIPYHSRQAARHDARPIQKTHTAQCQLRVHEPPDGVARIYGALNVGRYLPCGLNKIPCTGISRVPPSSPPTSQTPSSRRDSCERYIASPDRNAHPGACPCTRRIWFWTAPQAERCATH